MYSAFYYSPILTRCNFSRQNLVKLLAQNFAKTRPAEGHLFHADKTKLTVAFCIFQTRIKLIPWLWVNIPLKAGISWKTTPLRFSQTPTTELCSYNTDEANTMSRFSFIQILKARCNLRLDVLPSVFHSVYMIKFCMGLTTKEYFNNCRTHFP